MEKARSGDEDLMKTLLHLRHTSPVSGFQFRRLCCGQDDPPAHADGKTTKIKGTGTMPTTVAEVMSSEVPAIAGPAGYKEIAAALRRHGVSTLPVLAPSGRVIGIVSAADLLDKPAVRKLPSGTIRLAWQLRQWSTAAAATAVDLMTAPAVTIVPEAPVAAAAALMLARQVGQLPVVDTGGQLAGMISRADVLSVFDRPDELIRDDVLTTVIAGDFGLDAGQLQVAVSSGVVTIASRVDHGVAAMRLVAAVWQVEGVLGVRNRLYYHQEDKRSTPVQQPRARAAMGLD
jgi:CBS domain-containing protein